MFLKISYFWTDVHLKRNDTESKIAAKIFWSNKCRVKVFFIFPF